MNLSPGAEGLHSIRNWQAPGEVWTDSLVVLVVCHCAWCMEFVKVFRRVQTPGVKGIESFLAHSKNELIQWRGVRRLSVRLSVNFCANRFFSQANGRIATKLAHDGLRVSVHPGYAQGQGQGRR